MKWVRTMVRYLADQGRTVFLSSHLMSEMAVTADDLIVIGRGRIVASGPVQEVNDAVSGTSVLVRSPRASDLAALLAGPGVTVTAAEPGLLLVRGVDAPQVGETAAAAGLPLHELIRDRGHRPQLRRGHCGRARRAPHAPDGVQHPQCLRSGMGAERLLCAIGAALLRKRDA